MNSIIGQIAIDKGITVDDVQEIFACFSSLLSGRIPELSQVLEDIVVNEKPAKLEKHIREMIILFHERKSGTIATWSMPEQNYIISLSENAPLF